MVQVAPLIEQIYEAAVLPEHWSGVLEGIASFADAEAAALLLLEPGGRPRHVTSASYERAFEDYMRNGADLPNLRPQRALERMPMCFAHDLEVLSAAEIAADPIYERFLRPHGFAATAGTIIPVPTGDLLVFDIARSVRKTGFTRQDMDRLDILRPHLARAALLSHRLQLQAARATADALERVGLAAAVLRSNGAVLATNKSLLDLDPRLRIGAHDRVHLYSRHADALLAAAIADRRDEVVKSIPIAESELGPAMIVHLVPVRRAAHEIFAGAGHLMLVTMVMAPAAPLTEVLCGLFDLTPAEARVAKSISLGHSVSDISRNAAVSRETVRTQLKSLMMKTGTTRQAELAALLSGTRLAVRI